ncbi:LPXTG-motif cell wall anchor domain-containing protein/fimbrial isopeptide formation D2 domain-containing protein [Tessaracoccus bendigoensis DSM 12906]|uniref:LPXTG-motif cell wall anchor domain-containing protein/fimbrial isopeptide formation D2 domain-containing protein n=1 Tax=Tessaracoccus bendigoensis DSM 12906 TaxID=1123357 RepID=A0A1M6LWC2_9ACTN|nr:SpaH/EbpB family LPXTG-anchored major pilin [Tessaracoccus bendigoensis]SHJ75465.1 LPXTG-motif cell wall anchor domain-containing protein/fimbrial isopeptide formation D2 domain-containing protein [Tessaracoccus bendigoensis DSM 12906]
MGKNTALRRFAAGVGAVALGLAGTLAMTQTASADVSNVGPDQPEAPTQGTLTINKYAGSHTATPNPEDLLDGVEFTVTQVGRDVGGVCTAIDLTDAAQWTGLDTLFASAPATPAAPFCLTTVAQDDVTVDGQVVFDLNVGIYFVQETDPGDNPIVSAVPNFYVSIPTSNGEEGDGWNYNVVADPKNQLMEGPTKTIEGQPSGLVVGSNVTWPISVPIPTLNNNDTFDTASIYDTLDSRLTYVSSTLSVGGTELVEGTDYNVSGNVVWTFTEEGRAILDANHGGIISVSLVTRVDGEFENGDIPNNTYGSEFNGASVPGEKIPHTYWGQLSILKSDDSTPVKALEGAQFQVFLPNAAGTCEATAPATGSIATGTSDEDGVVIWAGVTPSSPLGLWVANSPDGPIANPSKNYCVYETVAPAGHTASTAGQLVTIVPGVESVNEITVVNQKKDGPDLPLTGAEGTLAMTVGGLLLVGAGAAAIIVSRRRRTAA